MERNDAEKLLNEYEEHLRQFRNLGDIEEINKDFLDSKFNNCLEAKPKALHSMKEAKEICTFCGSPEISWYGNDDDKTFFCFDCNKVQSD